MAKKTPPEVRYYSTLIGKTVKTVVMNRCLGQTTYGLEFTDGTIAWVDCDPEGNGPGFLDIQAHKQSPKQ